MEHDDKRLPLDTRTLGALAEKCHAFAKALHYKARPPLPPPPLLVVPQQTSSLPAQTLCCCGARLLILGAAWRP